MRMQSAQPQGVLFRRASRLICLGNDSELGAKSACSTGAYSGMIYGGAHG
jgi:hypothetical protein